LLVLALFALLAGAATAVTPCVLPILPALLSATGTGGRRRPAGVVIGLAATFFLTIIGLATVVGGVGLGDAATRTLAVVVLAGFGVALVFPALLHPVEDRVAGLSRLGPRDRGDGLRSGLAVGAALGFLYVPCAGPILAGVIAVSATGQTTVELAIVAAAYVLGLALVLLAIALGARRALLAAGQRRVRSFQRASGVVMVLTAVVIVLGLDIRFQESLAADVPALLVNPTRALEQSDAVHDRLAELRGAGRLSEPRAAGSRGSDGAAATPPLPKLQIMPYFTGTQRWFNTPGSRPLTMEGLRGRVVLVDFWTYSCINCIRTLPFVRDLDERYRDAGLTVVGIHTPEFAFERDASNVADATERHHIRYPVAQDNDYATFHAWEALYWPAKFLVDATGHLRYWHFGEGRYGEIEAAVRALLKEAGAERLEEPRPIAVERRSPGTATPETYLGHDRAERFLPTRPALGTGRRVPVPRDQLPESGFTLGGTWHVDPQSATAVRGATIDAVVRAREVYLVLSARPGRTRRLRVLVDGRPVRAAAAGRDVRDGVAAVRGQRLYRLVSLPRARRFSLTLELDRGIAGYAFTFG
jgi:cytochrome c biogenesis protein CcdA/thiol-disulfide isomerase/thioredoxin